MPPAKPALAGLAALLVAAPGCSSSHPAATRPAPIIALARDLLGQL